MARLATRTDSDFAAGASAAEPPSRRQSQWNSELVTAQVCSVPAQSVRPSSLGPPSQLYCSKFDRNGRRAGRWRPVGRVPAPNRREFATLGSKRRRRLLRCASCSTEVPPVSPFEICISDACLRRRYGDTYVSPLEMRISVGDTGRNRATGGAGGGAGGGASSHALRAYAACNTRRRAQ